MLDHDAPRAIRQEKMIREWVSKFRRSVNKRAVPKRCEFETSIIISLGPDRNTGSLLTSKNAPTIRGETRDLSSTGIGFVVSSIRLKETYLVGEGRVLNAEINLPGGKIKMDLIGQRYNQIGQHVSATQYLVGAKIIKISDTDREVYNEFLNTKQQKNTGSLKLGIDEG